MKVVLNILVSLLLFVSVVNARGKGNLRFNDNGKFKIVQFTDTHINFDKNQNLQVYQTVESIIKIEKPDFIVFTG